MHTKTASKTATTDTNSESFLSQGDPTNTYPLKSRLSQFLRWEAAALKHGVTLSEWLSGVADRAASISAAPISLDEKLVDKIRASIIAVRKNQTLEEFLEEMLADMLQPHSGLFEGLIEDEQRREKIEAKLAQIRRGDF